MIGFILKPVDLFTVGGITKSTDSLYSLFGEYNDLLHKNSLIKRIIFPLSDNIFALSDIIFPLFALYSL